jgi:hypothetical protein
MYTVTACALWMAPEDEFIDGLKYVGQMSLKVKMYGVL